MAEQISYPLHGLAMSAMLTDATLQMNATTPALGLPSKEPIQTLLHIPHP
jgi:hypothetical protein